MKLGASCEDGGLDKSTDIASLKALEEETKQEELEKARKEAIKQKESEEWNEKMRKVEVIGRKEFIFTNTKGEKDVAPEIIYKYTGPDGRTTYGVSKEAAIIFNEKGYSHVDENVINNDTWEEFHHYANHLDELKPLKQVQQEEANRGRIKQLINKFNKFRK